MPPKFGTSGLRGLVTELTPELIGDHVAAFIAACPVGTGLYVGRDLRPSSPAMAADVMEAARARGVDVTDCGAVPTPALALAAMAAGAAAVMITGSHIPADRNGLKFYTPTGEITKTDEAAILSALSEISVYDGPKGAQAIHRAGPAYVARYVDGFGARALSGLTIGAYTHSTVGRDLMMDTLRGLGAKVVELGRSDTFIPVDTEAVDAPTRTQLADWAGAQKLSAIVSMDGDGDRPLLTDATGQVVPGDVLGQITAQHVQADVVVTPVSSNTGVRQLGFTQIIATRIGSPYVIAGMEEAPGAQVVGYEANGGFLMGFDGKLPRLATRDSLLPIIATLVAAKAQGSVAALVATQPDTFTAADRLQDVPTETSQALVTALETDPTPFLSELGSGLVAVDRTDGLRMTLKDGRIVHLRPSGNAPELRCYVEAKSPAQAQATLGQAVSVLRGLVGA